eukprot:3957883-Amphidinium_carterae.2
MDYVGIRTLAQQQLQGDDHKTQPTTFKSFPIKETQFAMQTNNTKEWSNEQCSLGKQDVNAYTSVDSLTIAQDTSENPDSSQLSVPKPTVDRVMKQKYSLKLNETCEDDFLPSGH